MPENGRRELTAAIKAPQADVRRRALWLVTSDVANDPVIRTAVLEALTDPVWCVREAGASAVGRFADLDDTFFAAIVGLTLHDPSPFVRLTAAKVIGPRVVPRREYGTAVTHRFERQRARAAAALSCVTGPYASEAAALLLGCVSDSHLKVRLEALRSLAHLPPEVLLPAVPLVVRKCAESNPKIACAAREVWARLLTAPGAEVLHPLRAFPGGTDAPGVQSALSGLATEHPLRQAGALLPLPENPRHPAQFSRYLAVLCENALARFGARVGK